MLVLFRSVRSLTGLCLRTLNVCNTECLVIAVKHGRSLTKILLLMFFYKMPTLAACLTLFRSVLVWMCWCWWVLISNDCDYVIAGFG